MFFKFQEGFFFDSEHEVWISVGQFFEFLKTIGLNFLNNIKIKESPVLVFFNSFEIKEHAGSVFIKI